MSQNGSDSLWHASATSDTFTNATSAENQFVGRVIKSSIAIIDTNVLGSMSGRFAVTVFPRVLSVPARSAQTI